MPFPALLIWGAIGAATAYGAKKVIDAVTDSDSDSDGYTTTSGPSKEEVKEDNRKRILSDIKKSVNDFVRNNEKLVVFKCEESTDQDEISQSFGELFNDITDILERLSVVNKDSNIVDTLNYVNDSLSDLREMIKDSLTDSFNTRSFVENQIILERFITIYTMLIKILEKISNKKQLENNSNNKNKRE